VLGWLFLQSSFFTHPFKLLFSSTPSATLHMDHHNCLEVTIVKGNAFAVQELAENMIALRGVKSGNLTMSSTGGDLH
ncbi:MAG: hypothetical protein D3908_16365, partial [Candidatus Electrothrix sp. AUS4]|nr:hypothetical protein [Candidatus Electrothrix sp. AUS4]